MSSRERADETVLCHAGREPRANHGIVNPPVYHASTVLFPTVEALEAAEGGLFDVCRYGRVGTPTSWAFERAVAALEGGSHAISLPSGLSAVATALLAFARAGDHLLVADTAYGPTRKFCDHVLARLGVETEYYDPLVGAGVETLFRPNTRLLYLEAPGSLTFEMQDVPAMAEAARRRGVKVLMDNTWATPLYFKPFDHGVDVSIHAATKYMVGHSDAMLGVVVCRDIESAEPVKRTAVMSGAAAGPDDLYLGQRGLRSMAVRLARHQETALRLAEWLGTRPEVTRVLHPGLPGDPGHAIWRRDFKGASGLFGFVLRPSPKAAVAAMLDHMELFGMGFSWGGYESLILPAKLAGLRTARRWEDPGVLIRVHAGLEDFDDLRADLEAGLERLGRAA